MHTHHICLARAVRKRREKEREKERDACMYVCGCVHRKSGKGTRLEYSKASKVERPLNDSDGETHARHIGDTLPQQNGFEAHAGAFAKGVPHAAAAARLVLNDIRTDSEYRARKW